MRWVSFDDTEAGVLALGRAPVGIVAIGATPVGIVALGAAAVGVVTLTVGVGAGAFAYGCGVNVGVWARGVGLALGFKAECTGADISILETTTAKRWVPRSTKFDDRLAEAVHVGNVLCGRYPEAWVLGRAVRNEEGAWEIDCGPISLVVEPAAHRTLDDLVESAARIVARVVARTSPDASREPSGYRAAPPPRLTLHCEEVAVEQADAGTFATETVFDLRGLLWKLPLWLFAIAFASFTAVRAIRNLELDQRATAVWQGRVREVTGASPAVKGRTCELTAALRTDGGARQKAAVRVVCGEELYTTQASDLEATIEERREGDGAKGPLRYRLRFDDKGRRPDHDNDNSDDGSPSLHLDTGAGTASIAHTYPRPWRVELDVEPWSKERSGNPIRSTP